MNKIPTKKSGFNPNWQIKTLNEVCNKISAGGDKPEDCTTEKTEENQIPIFSNGIKNKGLCGYTKTPAITKPALTISARGTIGFACVRYDPFFPIVRLICVIPNEKLVVLEFLCYALQYIIPQGEDTSVPQLTIPNFKKIEIPIPPLDEQKRIAAALSKIDAYLENTIKLIEEKERFKRGIAKKLLTCKEGENIPEARFKEFNDDWRKEKLSSMIKIQGGYAFKSSEFKKSGIPIIRISNISNTDNNMNMKEVVYYNEIENEKSFIIKKSDLLIALSGVPGKSSIYNLEEKAYLNQRVGLFKIIDTKKINNSFLSQYVFSSIFQNKLKPFITRGVQPNISPKDIENLDILLPSLKEQEKIGGYLSLLDEEIDNLKKQKELIKEMKRGAMQKLLSGEVRLLE